MIQQIYQHLAMQFKLPIENVNQAGTTIMEDRERDPSASQIIWTLGEHVIIRIHPSLREKFQALIEIDRPLSIEKIRDTLNVTMQQQDNWYAITQKDFVLIEIDYTVRELTEDDASVFAEFQAQCSERDLDYGQISLKDETIFGAFDGGRLIAVASTFEWYGFVDFGVLTDPAYRGQGLGKAIVSAIVNHYLENDEKRHMLYRHESSNIGSKKIAQAVGWQRFAIIDYLRFQETETA